VKYPKVTKKKTRKVYRYPLVTLKKLNKLDACESGIEWFENQDEKRLDKVCLSLIESQRPDWANWTIVRYMTDEQKRQYAIYAAEQVIDIFEKEYPSDKRPRLAIEAAKNWVKSPAEKNRAAAASAASAAYAAYAAASAAAAAASASAAAAASAAYAVYAASAAAYAASAAAYYAASAAYAVYAASAAYAAAKKEMQIKIIKYGLTLIQGAK